MSTTPLRLATNTEFGARRSIAVLLMILLAVSVCSAFRAVSQPFWYDEICTVIVSRLPSASDIWGALDNAADNHPPVFYLVTRMARHLVSDDHLGYRLPSILGLVGTIFCVFFILSRRVNHLSALVGATFVLCTPVGYYVIEARPYALLLGCISGAILAWQHTDDSMLYSLVVALTLAAAVSLHYYAILVWPAFFLAEGSLWIFHRRFRISTWAALFIGALPLLVFAPLLLKLRQYYGQNFWAQPSIKQTFLAYDWLFNFGRSSHWGWISAAGITVIFLYFNITKVARSDWSGHRQAEVKVLPIEEQTLTLMLLWLPVIAFVAAKVSHGAMTDRYMLPTVLGGALALGYVIDKVSTSAGRALLLILLLMNYASSSVGIVKNVLKGSLLEPRATAAHEGETIIAELHEPDLPIVISSGLQYLPMAYYTPSDSRRLYAIVDPRPAVTFTSRRSDNADLDLLALRRYFPLQVEDYGGFVSRHREFLLVSDGDQDLDWWPARLAHDGYTLRLLSVEGKNRVYKVTVGREENPERP